MHTARPRLLAVLGTRPEVIKLAPVLRGLRRRRADFDVQLCAVSQQFDMLDRALSEWKLAPDWRVALSRHPRRLSAVLGAMLPRLERLMRRLEPEAVLVQGDTTTALGAALAAFYSRIPICHVEAGLRTGDLERPFPEEMNRVTIGRLATVHYAPTELARSNLVAEGRDRRSVVVVGNTVVDALSLMAPRRRRREHARGRARRLLLVTGHRRDNFTHGARRVCLALKELVHQRSDIEVAYVLHSNPRAFGPPQTLLEGIPRLRLLSPVGYRKFLGLLARCFLVITDSGGIQEEAPYLRKPVLVTRETTERPEAVQLGLASLVGTDTPTIVGRTLELLDNPVTYAHMARGARPFGDGSAARRICADLHRRFADRP